ncbi:HAAS signaling domain-containing protein [Tumebacillus permanentifrigoris]|uniref:Putative membrane protein n=1 Tax=Tumebacillus permanentifrigoris TaxID=378543 RepID=A0A316DDT0_9BACL|nr:DUF1700 domain-containing protein [Tumebacillus permanentifrigoris]PWK15788.1 putative membrane protein [Tumebacillus permanentifrigoris]
MNKDNFLKALEAELRGIDGDERNEILAEYREHFEIACAEGRDEAGVALALGNPKTLAKELKATALIEQAHEEFSLGKLFHAFFTAASLGFFNLVLLAGPFFAIVGLMLGLYAVALAFLGSPLVFFYMNGFPTTGSDVLQFVLALLLSGVGYFLGRGLIWVTKWMYKWVLKYLAYNVKLVKGNTNNEA